MTRNPVVPKDGGALVRPPVSPNANSTELQGAYGDASVKLTVALKVAAPPVGGEANAEVERFVAWKVGAEPSRVREVLASPPL